MRLGRVMSELQPRVRGTSGWTRELAECGPEPLGRRGMTRSP